MSDDEALVRRGQTLPLDAKQDLAQRGLDIVRETAIREAAIAAIGGLSPEKRILYLYLKEQFERGTLKPGGRVVVHSEVTEGTKGRGGPHMDDKDFTSVRLQKIIRPLFKELASTVVWVLEKPNEDHPGWMLRAHPTVGTRELGIDNTRSDDVIAADIRDWMSGFASSAK